MREVKRLFILSSFLVIAPVAGAQPLDSDGIRFLKFRITPNAVELIESTIRPGRLKPTVEASRAMRYVASRKDGSVGWEGDFDDPLFERLEYVDDDGSLTTFYRRHEEAVVLVRIPASPELEVLRLFGPARSTEVGKGTHEPVLIAEIDLDE